MRLQPAQPHRETYHDLGNNHFTRLNSERATRRAVNQLNQLGFAVTLNPIEPTTKAA